MKKILSAGLATVLSLGMTFAHAQSSSNASAVTSSQSNAQGGGGGAGYGGAATAQGGGGGNATAGGAQVGATTAGNTQNFAPVTNYNTPDVQTIRQTVDGTQAVKQEVIGHTSTDSTIRTDGNQTNLNLVGGVQGQQVQYSGSYTVKNVAGLGNVNLTSGIETCLGSWSAGGSVPGFAGQIGSTVKDEDCNRRKDAVALHNQGLQAAALELHCTKPELRQAILRSWKSDADFLCADDQEERARARAAGQTGVRYIAPVGTVALGSSPVGSTVAANGRVLRVCKGYENANVADPFIMAKMAKDCS